MHGFGNRLIARLRVGSVLSTRRGAIYRVVEPFAQRARNGVVVLALVLLKTAQGQSPQTVLMPLGLLTNLLRRGVRHKPGKGAAIDWAEVQGRAVSGKSALPQRRSVPEFEDQGLPAPRPGPPVADTP